MICGHVQDLISVPIVHVNKQPSSITRDHYVLHQRGVMTHCEGPDNWFFERFTISRARWVYTGYYSYQSVNWVGERGVGLEEMSSVENLGLLVSQWGSGALGLAGPGSQ